MRISDKERRGVAAKLRADHRQDHESQVTFIARMVTGKDRVTVVDVLRLPETLADLIDRPTCHIRETDHEYEDSVRCDRCQMTFKRPWEPFKYCPNCGAEVRDERRP